jgi:alpha-tubulin suppressor-like RCC1 family protein
MTRKHLARVCLALAPFVWGCSTYDLEGMSMESPTDQILVGDTTRLSIMAHDGSVPVVVWTSSDSAIATVDDLGVVTGKGAGWVRIAARTADYRMEVSLLVLETAGPFTSIETGVNHSCALAEDGSAWCWGRNEHGQIGTPFSPDRCFFTRDQFLFCAAGAIPVETDLRFTEIAAGYYHNCGLTAAGTAHCWGLNDQGQLGDGGNSTRPRPVNVVGDHIFKSLTSGGRTTCGITVDDALLCWGSVIHADAEAAEGLTTPTRVAAEHQFAIATTSGFHTCGVTLAGATYCWGGNTAGELGVEQVDSICGPFQCTPEPQGVVGVPPFTDLALGRVFSCGLTASGVVHCWGGNDHGQLGDGTRTGRWEPMPVAGGHAFGRLSADARRACGVDGDGFVFCWGRDAGDFGNGGEGEIEVDQPTLAAGGLTFSEMAVGFEGLCGIDRSGVAWCWGPNIDGALGNGRAQRFPVVSAPVRVIRHPDV